MVRRLTELLLLQLFMFLAMSLSAASFTRSEDSAMDLHDLFQQLKVKLVTALGWNSYSHRIKIMWFLVPLPCMYTLNMFLKKISKTVRNSFWSIVAALDSMWINELSG